MADRLKGICTRYPERVVASVIIAGLCGIPLITGNAYQQTTAALIMLNAILGMSVTVLFGYAGQLSFAYAALYGVGAYISTYAVLQLHMPQLVGVALAGVGTVMVGLVIAFPAFRIRGLQLGLVTLALSLAAQTIFGHISGYEGMAGIPYFRLGSYRFVSADRQLLLFAVLIVVEYIALSWYLSGRSGRRFLLLKSDEATAATVGLNVATEKMMAFAVSSLVLGLVGGIYPMLLTFLGPELFSFDLVITLFLIVIVGGSTRLEGAILGATVFGLVHVLLKGSAQVAPVLYGVAMLLTLILLPGGLIGIFSILRRHQGPVALVETSAEPVARAILPGDGRPILEVAGVAKNFRGLRALSDAGLEVRASEILGLIGSNGAGKSTFINIVTGHMGADAGIVRFLGQDITRWPPHHRARAGLVRTFQFPTLVPELSVRENLLVSSEAMGWGNAEQRVDDALEAAGLAQVRDASIQNLPFGMQKVVDLARAIVTNARVVLLDEPVAGLSPTEWPIITTILTRLRAGGVAVLVVEHNMPFIMPLADRVVVLDHGRVIATGEPSAIVQNTEVVSAYLGQPVIAPKLARGASR